jgi:hypothetical protein
MQYVKYEKQYDYVRRFAGIKHLAIDRFQDWIWGPMVSAYIRSHFEDLESGQLVSLTGIEGRITSETISQWIALMDRPTHDWEMGIEFWDQAE